MCFVLEALRADKDTGSALERDRDIGLQHLLGTLTRQPDAGAVHRPEVDEEDLPAIQVNPGMDSRHRGVRDAQRLGLAR